MLQGPGLVPSGEKLRGKQPKEHLRLDGVGRSGERGGRDRERSARVSEEEKRGKGGQPMTQQQALTYEKRP